MRLGTTQSSLSTRLSSLERSLGVVLFERHSRGVQLTAAGARLLPFAEQIHDLTQQAIAAATSPADQGPLRLGAIEIVAATTLPAVLTALTTSMIEASVHLATGTTAELIDAVRAGRLDVAIVADNGDLGDLPVLHLDRVPLALARIRGPRPVRQLFGFGEGCVCTSRLRTAAEQRGWTAPLTRLTSVDAITGAVAAGLGATVLPRSVLDGRGLQLDGVADLTLVLVHRPDTLHSALQLRRAYGDP